MIYGKDGDILKTINLIFQTFLNIVHKQKVYIKKFKVDDPSTKTRSDISCKKVFLWILHIRISFDRQKLIKNTVVQMIRILTMDVCETMKRFIMR